MISFLVANPIVAALVWAAMYVFDYTATLWFARLYHDMPNRHIIYEGGVEMNPVFEKDIASLRLRPASMDGQIKQSYWLSQRLISYDAFAYGLVFGIGWLASARPFFIGGALVCFMLAVRHFFLANRVPRVKA